MITINQLIVLALGAYTLALLAVAVYLYSRILQMRADRTATRQLMRVRMQYIGYLQSRLGRHGIHYSGELQFVEEEEEFVNQILDKIEKEMDDQLDFGLGV